MDGIDNKCLNVTDNKKTNIDLKLRNKLNEEDNW